MNQDTDNKRVTFLDASGNVVSESYYPVGQLIQGPDVKQYHDFFEWEPQLFQDARVVDDITYRMVITEKNSL